MNEQIQIGNVIFNIESPFPIPWKKEDYNFVTVFEEHTETIPVIIQALEILPELSGRVIYRNDSFDIWLTKDGDEIRAHRAMFAVGHPIYAHTYWKDETLYILYCINSDIWNNPNMSIWNLLHLENHLLHKDSLILHCCYMENSNEAILITAPSGTGKTTHAKLWEKCFKSKIVNGDRALLQREAGIWKANGCPLHGSAAECENLSYPIKAIVVIRQGKDDYIEELSLSKKISCKCHYKS